jgi:hypothetical protein
MLKNMTAIPSENGRANVLTLMKNGNQKEIDLMNLGNKVTSFLQ